MNKIFQYGCIAAAFALPLGGCATDRSVALSPGIELTDLTTLPAPVAAGAFAVGPQESLEISVLGAEALSGTYFTDSVGTFEFPLIGSVEAGGLSVAQVGAEIANRLRGEYVLDPQVNVRPANDLSATVSIGGEVIRPGTYPANTSFSLLRTINNAGGMDEFAKEEDVLILRRVDGTNYIGVYNYEAIARGNAVDPTIYPGDIVMVGDSPSARRLAEFLQLVPVISTSAILIDRLTN